MIKELLENLEVGYKLCFICQDKANFKLFLDTCQCEGIVFSKLGHNQKYEYMFPTYTAHLDSRFYPVAMISKDENEYQFYARNYKNPKDNYNDEHLITYLDFTQILRNRKLDELGI